MKLLPLMMWWTVTKTEGRQAMVITLSVWQRLHTGETCHKANAGRHGEVLHIPVCGTPSKIFSVLRLVCVCVCVCVCFWWREELPAEARGDRVGLWFICLTQAYRKWDTVSWTTSAQSQIILNSHSFKHECTFNKQNKQTKQQQNPSFTAIQIHKTSTAMKVL